MKRSSAILAAAAAVALAGCGDGKKKLRRSGDAGAAVVVVDRGPTGAPLVAEVEPNDTPDKAQPLELGTGATGVKGTIGAGATDDKDSYALTVAAAGTLSVRVTGAADADLAVDIIDAAGKRLASSDNGKGGTLEGVPNLGVQPGKYTIVVREFIKKEKKKKPKKEEKGDKGAKDPAVPKEHGGRQLASQPYVLEAQLGPPPPPGEEIEPDNDAAAFAAPLAIGGSATAFIGWRNDRDVWKVALDAIGDDDALSVDVDGVADVALRVSILDGTENVLLERVGKTGEAVALRNVAVRAGEPHYFLVVSAKKANLDERYTVRLSTAPFQLDEESEPNDAPASAGALSDVPGADSGIRVGFLGAGDTDVYQLEPSDTPRLLQLTLEPPSAVDAALEVVDAAKKALAGPADAARKGGPEKLADVPVPAGVTLFVRVSLKSGCSATERYRLRWSAVPAPSEPEPVLVPGIDDDEVME